MSRGNVEIVKASIDAHNREDWDAMLETTAPDFELDWSRSRGLRRGVYRRDQVRRFLVEFAESWESVRIEPVEFIEAGGFVVVPQTTHATGRDGIELVGRVAMVYEMRGGKIQRISMYQERQDALEAVGFSEQLSVAGQGESIVRRWSEVVNRSQSVDAVMAALEDLIHPEAEWVNPEDAIEGGTRKGPAGIRAVVESWFAGAGPAATIELEQLYESGDRVLARVRTHARGASSGADTVGPPAAMVFTIRDGQIFRIEWHWWTDETLNSYERREPTESKPS